MGTEVRCEA